MLRNSVLASLALVSLSGLAQGAQIGQATTPVGAAFASGCAGFGNGSNPTPGPYEVNYFASTMTCNGGSSAVGGSVSGTASSSGTVQNGNTANNYSNSATASASVGVLRLYAISDGSTATRFSGSIANAGYNDRVTIGGGSGDAYWVLPFHIEGMMTAPNLRGVGDFKIAAYKNQSLLGLTSGNTYPIFSGLNSTHYGSASANIQTEVISYGVTNYGPNDPSTYATLAVDHTRFMVIPFTFGVSFEYGIWANASANEGSSASFSLGQSVTTVDFGNTIAYAGGAYAIGAGNSTISNLTYTSASGFDYQNAASPEPATWLLGGLSLLTGAVWRKTRSRQG